MAEALSTTSTLAPRRKSSLTRSLSRNNTAVINGVTPQAGLRPGGEDARVNVELAARSQQLVDRAKTDPQTMSRLTKIAGTNAHPGMRLAAAQTIVADESPEIVEWARPASEPLFGLV